MLGVAVPDTEADDDMEGRGVTETDDGEDCLTRDDPASAVMLETTDSVSVISVSCC